MWNDIGWMDAVALRQMPFAALREALLPVEE
jgi:hypothetical protein